MSNIYMKEDCDFLIRNNGIVRTENNMFEDLKIKVLQRIQAQFFDWAFSGSEIASIPGANFGQFVGSIVTDDLISKMKQNIIAALTDDDLVEIGNINIQEITIDQENIIFHISILKEEAFNEVGAGLSIFYNTRQNITTSKIEEIREELWL